MNILKVLLLFLLIVSSYAKDEVRLGLLYGKIFTSKKEAQIGSNLWLSQIKEKYPDENFSILFYEDKNKIINDYKDRKIDVIISNSIFYFENKELIDSLTLYKWVTSRTNSMFEQFYLIKNKKSKFNLENLDVQTILYREEVGTYWFEILLGKNKKNIKKAKQKLRIVEKSKKLVLNPFFKPSEVSIVGKDLYDSMLEINPQIRDRIEIVKKSKRRFVRGIGFTRKGISLRKDELLRDITDKINSTNTNFEVISFIQVQSIYAIKNDDELKGLYDFYNEYIRLKKSIK